MGGSPDTQETTTTTEPPEFVQPFSKRFLSRAEDLSLGAIQPPLPPGADRVQPLSSDELLAFDLLRGDILDGGLPSEAAAGLSQFLDPNSAFSPLANQLVDINRANTVDAFNTQVAPQIAGLSRASGSFGNTGVAELDAIKRFDLARALGETEAGIRGDFLDRSIGAASLVPAIAGARRDDLSALAGAGGQQRGIAQAIRDIDFQNLLSAREEPFTQLNVLGSAINTASGGFGRTTGLAPVVGGNPFISGLGAGGAFLGGVGSLISAFSSKDYKEDDAPAETILEGIQKMPVRSWRYKEEMGLGTDKHVGPYAEDFHDTFGLGDGKSIPYVDGIGVSLAGIKELADRVESLEGGD